MTPQDIAEVGPRLLDFTAEMLGGLARKDQRAAGELYVRGLLTDGRRKSMQPMAERLGVDHQGLQQFITSSTWDYIAVRRSVARWFASSQPVEALVVDDTGFPKDGMASPCVARQYSGTLGKIGNCQVGISVHLVSERASCAADWRLFCPESWDDQALDDPVAAASARCRRERAAIPALARHTEKWRLALEMIDEMTGPGGWGVLDLAADGGARPVVAADAGYGDNTAFRLELAGRGWQYAVAVKGTTSAYPAGARPVTPARRGGPGRPARPAYPDPPANLRQLAIASAADIQHVTWRQGTRATSGNPDAAMTSWFLAIRARPANRDIPRAPDGSLPECWLLAEWPPAAGEPTDYWLADLPDDTPVAELVRLAKIRWRIEHDYRELKTGLGLDHFEGRSYLGWHRHVTLAVLARAFCTMIRADPKDCDCACGAASGDENGGAHVARRRRLGLALRDRPKD
ncbi:MAG: IS701 family transposase [Streptosporangiaceae bacterium]